MEKIQIHIIKGMETAGESASSFCIQSTPDLDQVPQTSTASYLHNIGQFVYHCVGTEGRQPRDELLWCGDYFELKAILDLLA